MPIIAFTGIFFVGACIGSFLAVLIEQDTIHRSFFTGRSQCTSCKKVLQWYELIPLFSYPLQKGRCRTCGARIPRWIWYMEWYMAFLWMVTAMVLSSFDFSFVSILMHCLILTSISLLMIEDMRFQTISDSKTLPLLALLAGIFFWSYSSNEKVLFPYETSTIIV